MHFIRFPSSGLMRKTYIRSGSFGYHSAATNTLGIRWNHVEGYEGQCDAASSVMLTTATVASAMLPAFTTGAAAIVQESAVAALDYLRREALRWNASRPCLDAQSGRAKVRAASALSKGATVLAGCSRRAEAKVLRHAGRAVELDLMRNFPAVLRRLLDTNRLTLDGEELLDIEALLALNLVPRARPQQALLKVVRWAVPNATQTEALSISEAATQKCPGSTVLRLAHDLKDTLLHSCEDAIEVALSKDENCEQHIPDQATCQAMAECRGYVWDGVRSWHDR